jgi:hypothetical protein
MCVHTCVCMCVWEGGGEGEIKYDRKPIPWAQMYNLCLEQFLKGEFCFPDFIL